MGVWSQSIFGNDLACDARDAYRQRRANGDSAEKAVRHVRRELAEELKDADGKRTVWIALAAAQLKEGQVADAVRQSALSAIAWCEKPGRDPESIPFGSFVLAALRKKLGGGPPPKEKPSAQKLPTGQRGDVFAIRFAANRPEAVVVVAGATGNNRPPEYSRVVLLFDVRIRDVTPESIADALEAWRRYRQKWPNGFGRSIGCYDVNGKLPVRNSRLLLDRVSLPEDFARRMRGVGAIYQASELPYVIAKDLSDWKSCEWIIDPADR